MSSGNVNLELDSESNAPYPRSVKTSPDEDDDDAFSAPNIILPTGKLLMVGRRSEEEMVT